MKKFNSFLIAPLVIVLIWVYTGISWIWNLVKLIQCDFDPIGKEEILHLVGLFPPICWVTVWF